MNDTAIWNTLTQLFRDTFGDSELVIAPETTADDVEEWDSLTHIQLMVAVEKAFSIRLRTGEVAGLANVGELVERITQHLPSNPAD